MKRMEKILRLVAVGFSATELSRSSNELVDSTYDSAKSLMAAKAEEVRRVINRENKHSVRLKGIVAERQRNAQIEATWLRTWRPLQRIRGYQREVT